MKEKKDAHKKLRLYTIGIAAFSFVLTLVLYIAGFFTPLENKIYDSRMNAVSRFTTSNDDIVFIGIDQSSLNEASAEYNWSWPWPREAYAKVVEFMNIGGAQCVAFDVVYSEPSIYGAADDEAFAKANKDFGKTILIMTSSENAGVVFPIGALKDSAAMIANVTSIKDSDGVIRRSRLFFNEGGSLYPTLGLAPTLINVEEINKLAYSYVPFGNDGNSVRLRYKGSIDRYAHYRAIDIIKSLDAIKNGEKPEIEPENFEGATVFFLFYAPGLYDICSTPISEMYPGAGCHITLLDNLIDVENGNKSQSFVREPPLVVVLLYLALWAALIAFFVYKAETMLFRNRSLFRILSSLISAFAIIFAGYIFFAFSVFVPIVAPLFCFIITLWLGMLAAHSIEGKQKKFIQSAFSQYLSPKVIDNLIANPDALKLGGEKRNISIFFSDIQSFTTLSESLTPEKLTALLNEYLTAMTDTILASGGTIDKYEGDAIIAFWNAPTDEVDHAKRAVECAVLCQQKLEEMAQGFVERVGRPLTTRIGLNTGDAIVGNMGSSQRFDYTMLGDSVNLASRLEGINKQFGTFLLCSKETMEQAKAHGTELHFREIARVAVVGKSQAVTVFEPMTQETAAAKSDVLENFSAALDLFYAGKFAEAKAAFAKTAQVDPPAQKYIAKCEELIAVMPQEWNGVWVATSK